MSALPIPIDRRVVLGSNSHHAQRYNRRDLADLMLLLRSQKRTGRLTLFVISGEISVVEWKQKQKPLDS